MVELTNQQIEYFRQRLLEQKRDLNELLEPCQSSTGSGLFCHSSFGRFFKMNIRGHQEKISADQSAYRKHVKGVEQALERMKQGEYGFCCGCGEAILFQRLKIKPEVTVCADCKSVNQAV